MNKFEEIDSIREAWEQDTDLSIIKAATEDLKEYPQYVQVIIEAEVKNRGLWPKVLHLRGEREDGSTIGEGNLKGYVCENCKGTYLNFHTGRCVSCDLPSDDMGYCIHCDKFWSLKPGQLCPEHGVRLRRHKAAMALLRLGNFIFDMFIFRMLVIIMVIILAIAGLIGPYSLENINPVADWVLGICLFFLYYFTFEAFWQRTPAKFITGTKVVTLAGEKPSVGTTALRTLARLVPFDGLSFLGERVRGWHDKWSETCVIKAKRFERENLAHRNRMVQQEFLKQYEDAEKKSEIFSSQTVDESRPVNLGYIAKCGSCERMIGKLESSFKFKGSIVCTECFISLSKQF